MRSTSRRLLAPLFLLLAACNGGAVTAPASSDSIDIAIAITVEGRVLDSLVRRPAAGVQVAIVGRPPTVTDANGKFTVAGVVPPYDAIVYTSSTAIVYQGLTRSDPSLIHEPPLIQLSLPASAQVSGSLTGGAGWNTGAHVTGVLMRWDDENNLCLGSSSPTSCGGALVGSSGDYSAGLPWGGAPPTPSLRLYALQWALDGNGNPDYATGYGQLETTVTNGGVYPNLDIDLAPVSTSVLGGTVGLPPGANLDSYAWAAETDLGDVMVLGQDTATSAAFSGKVPVIPGATYRLAVTASGPAGTSVAVRQGLPVSSSLNVQLLPPPNLTAPADGTQWVDHQTVFTHDGPTGAVHLFAYQALGNGPSFAIFTKDKSVRIPDLSAYGLGLPAGMPYAWGVRSTGPASVDQIATRELLNPIYQLPMVLRAPPVDYVLVSEPRFFHTLSVDEPVDIHPIPIPMPWEEELRLRETWARLGLPADSIQGALDVLATPLTHLGFVDAAQASPR